MTRHVANLESRGLVFVYPYAPMVGGVLHFNVNACFLVKSLGILKSEDGEH